jgi:uncharacterized protein (DUF2235 family)
VACRAKGGEVKRIVICADDTWNKPEKDPKKDIATNLLRTARAIQPVASDGTEQVVFCDWGLGSYHASSIQGRCECRAERIL